MEDDERIEIIKRIIRWKELKKELNYHNIDTGMPIQFLQISWKNLRYILREKYKLVK
jgi:hypothetical protein